MTGTSKQFKRVGCGLAVALVVGFLFVGATGAVFIVEVPLVVAFGWLFYPARVAPMITLNPYALGGFTLVLVAAALGAHAFLRWLCAHLTPPRRWRGRDTGALVTGLILLFVVSMASTGIAHQVGWVITSDAPLLRSSWDGLSPVEQAKARKRCEELRRGLGGTSAFALANVPAGDASFHYVPLTAVGEGVGEVLIFRRDPGGRRTFAGVRCTPDRSVDLDEKGVLDTLAALRKRP